MYEDHYGPYLGSPAGGSGYFYFKRFSLNSLPPRNQLHYLPG
jgi:hypothetical protein